MITVTSVTPKIISTIKKGKINAKNIALPKETILANVTKSKTNHIGCGGLDTLCSMYNMF